LAVASIAVSFGASCCSSAFVPSSGAGTAAVTTTTTSSAFVRSAHSAVANGSRRSAELWAHRRGADNERGNLLFPNLDQVKKAVAGIAATGFLAASLFSSPAWAENELNDRYGAGLDTSLVDQTCLVDKCSLQAKACLADDPSCRKGLTCTAKCLGDNACITGCMARYGDNNLDKLLKCTIEDNECIKVAILPGGADRYDEAPQAPAPTVRNFDPKTLEGQWFKVAGYNPNYDCYACQRNSFTVPENNNVFIANDKLTVDVEFSMPHLLPDGSPPPPSNVAEYIKTESDGTTFGSKTIGLNDYSTRETMVFDNVKSAVEQTFTLNKGADTEETFARTAHSEGEMFGLSK